MGACLASCIGFSTQAPPLFDISCAQWLCLMLSAIAVATQLNAAVWFCILCTPQVLFGLSKDDLQEVHDEVKGYQVRVLGGTACSLPTGSMQSEFHALAY